MSISKAEWAGIFVAFLGVLILCAAIFNWNWVFEGKSRKISLPWIAERFGRRTARIVAIILGTLVLVYGSYFTIIVS